MFEALGAYLLWGLFPLYFPLMEPASSLEILAHRFVWTFAFMALALIPMRAWPELRRAPLKTWGIIFAAACFIAVNWGVYVYLVNSNQVAEAALGYFINPLVSVVLGMVFFRERLNHLQVASVAVAIVAVIVLTMGLGKPPVWGLALAFSFGLYGLMKKKVSLSAAASLTAESAVITPIAIGYLVWLSSRGESTFVGHGVGHSLLLLSAGIATAVPLLLFGLGAKKLPLSTIGLMQYITPVIQMLMAVFVFHEHLSANRWLGYIIIWISVALFIIDIVRKMRRSRQRRRAAGQRRREAGAAS